MKARILSTLATLTLSTLTMGCGESVVAPASQPGQRELAPAGALRIVTASLDAGPVLDSYTLRVDGVRETPIGPNDEVTMSPVVAGEHTIELRGLPRGCDVPHNPRTISVRSGSVVETRFEVSCGESPL